MIPAERSRLCIHTITHKPWGLAECCAAFEKAGVPAITLWRDAVEAVGGSAAGEMVKDAGLRVTSLCRGGFFPAVSEADRQAALDDNRRMIDLAATVGAPHVVLVCGAVPGQSLDESRKQIAEGIAAVLPHAQSCGVRLAIEPLHPQYAADRSAVNTMAQARRLCEAINRPGTSDVGIAVDVYHVWWDDALEIEISRAGELNLLHAFHVCDWKTQQADTLNDRGLMGEGVIDLRSIRAMMEKAGYLGDIEVEIFSNHHWAKDQSQFLNEVLVAYDACV